MTKYVNTSLAIGILIGWLVLPRVAAKLNVSLPG